MATPQDPQDVAETPPDVRAQDEGRRGERAIAGRAAGA